MDLWRLLHVISICTSEYNAEYYISKMIKRYIVLFVENNFCVKELWMQLHGHKEAQDSQKEALACDTSVRELRLEEQLAENFSIIDEQV